MSRTEADEVMLRYDRAKEAYRLAVRLGLPNIEDAFAKWNEAREELIGRLCSEAKEAA